MWVIVTPVTQHHSNGRLFAEQLITGLCQSLTRNVSCSFWMWPHVFASFPQIRCNMSWLFSGTREASRLEQAEHPAAQTLGKPSSRLRERWIKWPGFKNLTKSRQVAAGTHMWRQKHPSPDLGDTAHSSLNLCCVLQSSALLPWQKSPHSNNLFQRRLKRDSAHAQKCCTCSVSSLQRPFQRDHHKDEREKSGTDIFFLC